MKKHSKHKKSTHKKKKSGKPAKELQAIIENQETQQTREMFMKQEEISQANQTTSAGIIDQNRIEALDREYYEMMEHSKKFLAFMKGELEKDYLRFREAASTIQVKNNPEQAEKEELHRFKLQEKFVKLYEKIITRLDKIAKLQKQIGAKLINNITEEILSSTV